MAKRIGNNSTKSSFPPPKKGDDMIADKLYSGLSGITTTDNFGTSVVNDTDSLSTWSLEMKPWAYASSMQDVSLGISKP